MSGVHHVLYCQVPTEAPTPEIHVPLQMPPRLPKFNSLWRWPVCVCDCVRNIRGKAYKER